VTAILAYVAAAVVALWGVAHAVPTGRVLVGFEPISTANRRIVVQEWLAEAFTMWGVAAVVIAVTAAGGADPGSRAWVYRVAAGLLIALGALTALTGARTRWSGSRSARRCWPGRQPCWWPQACCRRGRLAAYRRAPWVRWEVFTGDQRYQVILIAGYGLWEGVPQGPAGLRPR
jgi:hypothetical protein